ncbi:unnamed protein product [Nezara viridula]|uniref:Superoxide dismutase copper/zinc binding domain-containing protein n=1 Tax=Nezara viridula TaxID=85310 RepID=A0A9P0HP05_NEZVI|nr:unnamed protein product [Nezara viridula]
MEYRVSDGLILVIQFFLPSHCAELSSHISENNIHGSITFFNLEQGGRVHILAKVDTQTNWSWAIHHLPVDYSELENRCRNEKLGPVLHDLTAPLGQLTNQTVSFETDAVELTGPNGIWSRSLLLTSFKWPVETAVSKWLKLNSLERMISMALSYFNDKARSDCNSLQAILLELSERLGEAVVGETQLLRDPQFPHTDIGSAQRNLYLVLLDNDHPDTFLTCARLRSKSPALLKAVVSSHGVIGSLTFSQKSILTPTRVVLNISRVTDPVLGGFRIHSLPKLTYTMPGLCPGIGDVFNPTAKPIGADASVPGNESQDKYAVGDVSGKLGYAAEREWDSFLPIFGKYSIAHRTLVIYRNGESGVEEPWICSTLIRYIWAKPDQKLPVLTAEVSYRYPLVGKIIMHQPVEGGETTVLVEGLVYSDGSSQNTTHEHRWGIHINPPGKDYFNWTARCVSAGPVFNPFMVNISRSPEYAVGDLTSRLGTIIVSGAKKLLQESRLLFTDRRLPLSGGNSIMGKSLVIFDDHGPKARGERLACSKIVGVYRRKAVVRDWYGNGFPTKVSGKIEFFQETPYSITDIEINLEGLEDVNEYQIHETPVMEILEFPCEETTLYDVYDPYNVIKYSGHNGTPDQLRVGDLSGKFGDIEDQISVQKIGYNDTNLNIFGPHSILGRSVVLHSKAGRRLACSTIERGYAPSEARELRAIASFHHPLGFASGYIRMTQLIHNDGSGSDTVIEVNLRHPGEHDRNVTYRHNWAIYVNPVGVDATVQVLDTRCTAAGYIWNPHYTQLANPLDNELYKKECGPDSPLRCYVGDLSGRLGPINLGYKRQVFSDPNIPLGEHAIDDLNIMSFNKRHLLLSNSSH